MPTPTEAQTLLSVISNYRDTAITAGWLGGLGSLIGAGVGAYLGAKFAFDWNTRAAEKALIDKRASDANRVIFLLGKQMELLATIKKQSLDPWRGNPSALINMVPTAPTKYEHLLIDSASISFLFDTAFPESVSKVMLAETWFVRVMESLEMRFELHFREIQPALDGLVDQFGEQFPLEQAKTTLGPRRWIQLKRATENLYESVDDGLAYIALMLKGLPQELKEIFPERKFLRITIPPEYFAPAASTASPTSAAAVP